MAEKGRPRTFDRSDALRKAMELFWKLGYEATTLADLQKAMGNITPPSFYAAFGNKEQLFREAVELYKETEGAPLVQALLNGKTARSSIADYLEKVAESFSRPECPHGCLITIAGINCMPSNQEIEIFLRAQRAQRHKAIRQRLARGTADGDVPAGLNLSAIAAYFSTVIDGLALQARDGASRKELKFCVRAAMCGWDALVRDAIN